MKFVGNHCVVTKGGTMSLQGRLKYGVYVMNGKIRRANGPASTKAQHSTARVVAVKWGGLWHERLGHAPMRRIKDLAPKTQSL